jgi:hypothetical protein
MGMSEIVNQEDYGKFLDKVLELDQNIRYVAIYDGKIHSKFREGIQGYFKQEEIESSLSEAQKRWEYRKKLSFKIGAPRFAMAQYTKVNRITFPLGNDAVILVTTELGIDIEKLVDRIIEISNPNNNDLLNGFYTR